MRVRDKKQTGVAVAQEKFRAGSDLERAGVEQARETSTERMAGDEQIDGTIGEVARRLEHLSQGANGLDDATVGQDAKMTAVAGEERGIKALVARSPEIVTGCFLSESGCSTVFSDESFFGRGANREKGRGGKGGGRRQIN